MEEQVADSVKNSRSGTRLSSIEFRFCDRVWFAKEQVVSTLKKVFPYILIGVGIGAFILICPRALS